MVASNTKSRQIIVQQINKYYKNAKNIYDIGSGFGGLTRFISKNTNANIYGLENMPFCVFISKIADYFNHTKSKTVWCDAFEYIDKTETKFDIVIAYLSPKTTQKLIKYKNKIRVLISLDFKLHGIKPTRVINVDSGVTIYGGKKYQNKIYVYEF